MTVEQKIREYVREAIRDALTVEAKGTKLQCQECGKKFSRSVSKSSEPKCPKCGGYDVDLDEGLKEDYKGDGQEVTDDSGKPIEVPEEEFREAQKTEPTQVVQMDEPFQVQTKEGPADGDAGDYLAKGVEGEMWPIDQEIFDKTHEFVDEGCKEGAGEEAEALAGGTKARVAAALNKLRKLSEPELRNKRKAINIALDDMRTGKTHFPPGKEASKTRATKGLELYLKLVVLAMDATQKKVAHGVKSEAGSGSKSIPITAAIEKKLIAAFATTKLGVLRQEQDKIIKKIKRAASTGDTNQLQILQHLDKIVAAAIDKQQFGEGLKETSSGIKSAVDRGIITHVKCNKCDKIFKATKGDAKCPKCGRSDFDIA